MSLEAPESVRRDQTEYTVVLRAHSAARFVPEEGWQLQLVVPALGLGGLRARLFTAWVHEGVNELPRELIIEMRGGAESLDEAVTKFAGIGRTLATVVGFVANVQVGPPEVYLAFDSTPSHEDREFLETFLPDEKGLVSQGRTVRVDLLTVVGDAVLTLSDESPRVSRALRHYELALRNWYVGGEWLALNHLWIAAENLTKAAVRREAAARGMTEEQLAHEYDLVTDDPNRPRWRELLGARVREAVIFGGDTETYRTAKDASDGLEHGIWELTRVNSHALRSADQTFHHVRRTLAEMLVLPAEVVTQLLATPPMDVQSLREVIRGQLEGAVEDPAPNDQLYPTLEWTLGIDSVTREGAAFEMKRKSRLTVRTHPEVRFRLTRYEVHGRLRDGQAPVELADKDLDIQPATTALSEGLMGTVMALVDAAAASGAAKPHTFASALAFNAFGQAVAYFQAAQRLITGFLPLEALPAVRSLTILAARFEAMADPSGPGLGIAVRALLDAIAASGADPELVESRLADVNQKASMAGISVPAALPAPEGAGIYRALEAEMGVASDVFSASYSTVPLRTSRDDEGNFGFHTKLGGGPLEVLAASAASMAMLATLRSAARLFDWTVDQEAVEATLTAARAANDDAALEDLSPERQTES